MLICAPFHENNNVLSRLGLFLNLNFIHSIVDLADCYFQGQKCHLAHYCFNPSVCRIGEKELSSVRLLSQLFTSNLFSLQIVPVSEGTFILTAFDLCLETRSPARATVFISEPHRIMLTVVDKVSVQMCVI